jgi:hypothetical protein
MLRSAALGLVWREEYEMSETYVQVEYGTHVGWMCAIQLCIFDDGRVERWSLAIDVMWLEPRQRELQEWIPKPSDCVCVEKRLKRKPRNTWARYFILDVHGMPLDISGRDGVRYES